MNSYCFIHFGVRHFIHIRKGSNWQGQARGCGVCMVEVPPLPVICLETLVWVSTVSSVLCQATAWMSRGLLRVRAHIHGDRDISCPAKQVEEIPEHRVRGKRDSPETCYQPATLILGVPRT